MKEVGVLSMVCIEVIPAQAVHRPPAIVKVPESGIEGKFYAGEEGNVYLFKIFQERLRRQMASWQVLNAKTLRLCAEKMFFQGGFEDVI